MVASLCPEAPGSPRGVGVHSRGWDVWRRRVLQAWTPLSLPQALAPRPTGLSHKAAWRPSTSSRWPAGRREPMWGNTSARALLGCPLIVWLAFYSTPPTGSLKRRPPPDLGPLPTSTRQPPRPRGPGSVFCPREPRRPPLVSPTSASAPLSLFSLLLSNPAHPTPSTRSPAQDAPHWAAVDWRAWAGVGGALPRVGVAPSGTSRPRGSAWPRPASSLTWHQLPGLQPCTSEQVRG